MGERAWAFRRVLASAVEQSRSVWSQKMTAARDFAIGAGFGGNDGREAGHGTLSASRRPANRNRPCGDLEGGCCARPLPEAESDARG